MCVYHIPKDVYLLKKYPLLIFLHKFKNVENIRNPYIYYIETLIGFILLIFFYHFQRDFCLICYILYELNIIRGRST